MPNIWIMSSNGVDVEIENMGSINKISVTLNEFFQDIVRDNTTWEAALIFSFIFRNFGKHQKIMSQNRVGNQKKDIEEALFIQTSQLMHYFKLDKTYINDLLTILNNEIDGRIPSHMSTSIVSKDTLSLAEQLKAFIQTTTTGLIFNIKKFLLNFIDTIIIRITFEKKCLDETKQTYKCAIKSRQSFGEWNSIPSSCQAFKSKYWFIINELAHGYDNPAFYFVDINQEIIKSAYNDLSLLK